MFPQNTQWKKIGLPEDFQLLGTARLQKTGRQSQKDTDRQTSAIRRMAKQNKRSNVESSIQKPSLNKHFFEDVIYMFTQSISVEYCSFGQIIQAFTITRTISKNKATC